MARTSFSQAQALAIVRQLSAPKFTGRRAGTPGHDRAGRWIARRFRRLGFRPRRHRFVADASTIRALAPPHAFFTGTDHIVRPIPYRFDFVEHPASAAPSGPLAGTVARLHGDPSMEGRWSILQPSRESSALASDQARRAARRGAIGLLIPARAPSGGTFFKQPFAAKPFPLPTLLVREELVSGWEGGRLELRARFRRRPLRGVNIIGELAGSAPQFAEQPVIVGAHYDGVGDDPGGLRFPGAADNSVGVAIILEAARALRTEARGGKRPIWFVAFDAEEAGAFGSRALARDLRTDDLRPIVLNVDAAVAPGRPLSIEGSPDAKAVFAILDRAGRQLRTPLAQAAVPSDNRSFALEGFTSVGIGVGGQGFHTPHDRASRIDGAALRSAGELVLETVRGLAD